MAVPILPPEPIAHEEWYGWSSAVLGIKNWISEYGYQGDRLDNLITANADGEYPEVTEVTNNFIKYTMDKAFSALPNMGHMRDYRLVPEELLPRDLPRDPARVLWYCYCRYIRANLDRCGMALKMLLLRPYQGRETPAEWLASFTAIFQRYHAGPWGEEIRAPDLLVYVKATFQDYFNSEVAENIRNLEFNSADVVHLQPPEWPRTTEILRQLTRGK